MRLDSGSKIAEKMTQCGYELLANGNVIESDVCITDTLNIEIRDGYQLTLIHPSIDDDLASAHSENWSVEGAHTVAIDENNIIIVTANEHFSAVSVADSDHLYSVTINQLAATQTEGGLYGFVTGERFTIELESQMGSYQDTDQAEVNTHYHYYLSDGDVGIIAPGDDWKNETKPIGGEKPPQYDYATVNVATVSIAGNQIVATAGEEADQSRLTKYPNVSGKGLPTQVDTDLGWVNIYVYSDFLKQNCTITAQQSGTTSTCDSDIDAGDDWSLSQYYEALEAQPRTDYIDGPTFGNNVFWRLAEGSTGAWGETGSLTLSMGE
ncbi:hypothetical protein GCM10007894_21020 [Paraferrimonas haliotis]|uniref:Uncharacterized protein n=2 Tax=Paraferrimonas haliotis TaxID=2013866 RepID=A0AA37WYT7_9GAMM|nr:hypothetical protein GCM10007894_21020 [Paraferrimonas haliotis]